MLAVKHLDPVLGIDIHLIITPPGAVVPIPHPHIGIIFDPFDYIPFIGATVKVNGLPRAQAGTGGIALPPHFPIGGVFAKPPGNEHETFMGSSTVVVDDEPFTYMTLPVLSCQDIGMPSPPRKRGPGAKTLLLPTSIALSIPAGPPVFVGGPPTISMTGMASRLALGALMKGLKKVRKLQKGSRKMKDLSDRIHDAAAGVMDKVGLGKRARDRVHKTICTFTGHPVDVVTGRTVTETVDWELPGPIPLKFERNYSSSLSWRDSVVGHGWSHSLDLAVWEEEGRVVYRAEDGREIEFDTSHLPMHRLSAGQQLYEPVNRLTLRRVREMGWEVESPDGLVHSMRAVSLLHQGVCKVTRTHDRAGFELIYEYDERGLLEWVVDSAKRRLRLEHDTKGYLSRMWLPHPTQPGLLPYNRYVYSEAGDLVEVHDALGHVTRYEYEEHLLTREQDRTGLSFYFEYMGHGPQARCSHTWGDGGIHDHRLLYDEEKNLTEVTDSLGHTTTYRADGRGVVVEKVDPLGNSWRYDYDDALRRTAEHDPLGNVTRYEYDARGNCVLLVKPDGARLKVEFNASNAPIRATDCLNNEWRWEWERPGRLLKKTNPLMESTRFEYRDGSISAIVNPGGGRFELGYDAQRNLSLVRNPDGSQDRYVCDNLGRAVEVHHAHGGVQRRRYDACGRVVEITEPDGQTRQLRYDAEGFLLEVRSSQEHLVFGYTGFHRLAYLEQSGRCTRRQYDTEGQLTSVEGEAGQRYHYVLDANGRVREERGFDGRTWRYEYDAAGRMTRVIKPSGASTTMRYDPAGRTVELLHSDGTFARFDYREDGALLKATNPAASIQFERDALGRILKEQQGDQWVASRYGPDGLRIAVESSLGLRQIIQRDTSGGVGGLHARRQEDTADWSTFISRNTLGLESGRYLPGGLRIAWGHDLVGRPTEHLVMQGNSPLRHRSYQWEGPERVLSLADSRSGTIRFEYDAAARLTAARLPDGTRQERLAPSVSPLALPSAGWQRGPGGQPMESPGVRYQHDADGNLVQRTLADGTTWTYEWNGAGQLVAALSSAGVRVTFEYDAIGRRLAKHSAQGTTRWLWDGANPVHELGSGTEPLTWLFEPESFTPLARFQGNQRHSIITDHLGTPLELYDEAGQLAWRMQLDIQGRGQPEIAHTSCPWRWPGQYEDPETGLYYNGARYYDPASGCYASQDPLRLAGGLALYDYVDNPVTSIDPLGLSGSCTVGQGSSKGTGAHYDKLNGQGLYVLVDNNNVVKYVGRGDAPVRGSKHALDFPSGKANYTQIVVFNNNLSKAEAKNLEQRLIKHFGGPNPSGSSTIQLDNKIWSYSQANPNATAYQKAVSDAEFSSVLQNMKTMNIKI
ncbi:hypothetical protein BO221_20300 [Archangium sp. Cb G35]|uniref:DUF6531 domain-containing protein n=1 Tax=Archangium sp. Cb G35 TaxID=1920190 RepID=UPI00093723F9|nr:DUF6531 domain-containing protein [Archangium sp. Cb G35]OJT23211.1 hypothetical protein BO221_20300 [Archangium sp. Cb G35]